MNANVYGHGKQGVVNFVDLRALSDRLLINTKKIK
jgi:hypothetical protein